MAMPQRDSTMEYREDTPNCMLEFEWIEIVKRDQPARARNATPCVMFPDHVFPYMLGRRWGDDSGCTTNPSEMKPATRLNPVTVSHNVPKTDRQDHLVRAFASITLDRESGAREFHKVYFTAEQWDKIVSSVHGAVYADEKVILEGCTIGFDPKDKSVEVNTETFYDYGDGEGFRTGISTGYIPGEITDVASISIARQLQFADAGEGKGKPDRRPGLFLTTLMSFDEMLFGREFPPCEPEDDCYDDDVPSLSDYYDDLEELELNTRGDGFD